jgi:hypothetical protein
MMLYAHPDAGIIIPGYEPDREEILISTMEISRNVVSEDRITALETRVRDMQALVNGLINELLDFRAVATTMTRQNEEHTRQDLARGSVAQGAPAGPVDSPVPPVNTVPSAGSTVIRPVISRVPAVPAEPAMVRIMQSDGTMKMETRYGENKTIDSSSRSGRTRKGGSA